MNIEIRCEQRDYNSRLAFSIFARGRDGHITHAAQPAVMLQIEEACELPEVAYLDPSGVAATRLMDDLWRAGVRPSQIGTAGHLAAIEQHLQTVQLVAQAALVANTEKDALIAEVVRAGLTPPSRVPC